jgi:hypothetical protein
VIREYISQATRPQLFASPMSIEQVSAQVNTMHRIFIIADETEAMTARLIGLLKAYPTGGKQVHDANIVATMLVNEVDTLATLNIDDLKRFAAEINLVMPGLESP